MAFLFVIGLCALSSSAAAYSFEKGSSADLQVYFNDPGDWKITYDDELAAQVAQAGMDFAEANGIYLEDRTLEDIADEIQFHAQVNFWLPNALSPRREP